jgi:oligoribonuclease NrnB/cAMP/cGMP phosphodiesterase (DHH superfamily)
MNPNEIDFVIYHNPCADGTGSAWAAWKYLKTNFPDREVTYFPTNYGKLPPDVTGKSVLLCDFSYKKNVLENMIKTSKNLLIIDHHKTAQKDLEDIDDDYKIFNMLKSGAYLTWEYFFPTDKVPLMIEYIQDNDIWTKKLPYCKEYASWFLTLDNNVELYDEYSDDTIFLEMLKTKGAGMVDKDTYNVEQAVPRATVKFQKIGNKYLFIAYLNTSVLKSEMGNKVILEYKYADFAAVYSVSDWSNATGFSLRSTNVHYDCSKIALIPKIGGGGHRNACGARLEYVTNVLPGLVLDNNQLYPELKKIYYEIGELNIVYLHSTTHKYALGAYLVQEKYEEKYEESVRSVQESITIIRVRDEDSDFYSKFGVSAIWSYDALTDETVFQVVFDKEVSSNDIDIFVNKYKLDEKKQVRYQGVSKYLVIDKISMD